jgi:hypothetical protein
MVYFAFDVTMLTTARPGLDRTMRADRQDRRQAQGDLHRGMIWTWMP